MTQSFDIAPIAQLDPKLAEVVEEAQIPVRELAEIATREYDPDFVELTAIESGLVSGASYLADKGDRDLLDRFREGIIVPRLSKDFPADEVQVRPSEIVNPASTAVKTYVLLASLDGSQTYGGEVADIIGDNYARSLITIFGNTGLVREGIRSKGLAGGTKPVVPTLRYANEIALNPYLQTRIRSLGAKMRRQLLDYSNNV